MTELFSRILLFVISGVAGLFWGMWEVERSRHKGARDLIGTLECRLRSARETTNAERQERQRMAEFAVRVTKKLRARVAAEWQEEYNKTLMGLQARFKAAAERNSQEPEPANKVVVQKAKAERTCGNCYAIGYTLAGICGGDRIDRPYCGFPPYGRVENDTKGCDLWKERPKEPSE